ncbi:hypothetical protein QJQ45_001517 [Haematococcus lacustris]|nr:hypothetical protein QJQ45_001517 [Haematococcus lacustris]
MADGAKELIGDIVAGIVGNLPLKDVLRCSQVCRAWRDACKDRRTPELPPAQCSACSPSSSSGLGVPLHMGAVKLYEHSRLPGSGQVDTPNSYSGFRVGPVLLGCFMLPRVPLHMLRLASRRQAMGTWVLWDPRLLLTPADLDCILSTAPKPPATSPTWPAAPNTLPTAAATAAPSSPSATAAAKLSSSSPSTAAAEPSTAAAAAAAAGMGTQACIPVHAAAGAVSGPHLGKGVPGGCLAAAGLRVAAWVGLRPGALLQGTCVTNFQTLDISTHQRLGSAMLGHLQVRVLTVTASPQAPPGTLFAPHNPLAEATLQLDLAARCHSISPFSPDVVHTAAEDDSAYTPAATLTARVVLMPDGTLHPAPAAADSGRPTSTGTEHLTTRPMLHAPAHLALTLSERLQAEGRVVPQPQLVDQWPVDMHGLASGGVLCGMLLHPVIGRATFCASIHGAAALCPLR